MRRFFVFSLLIFNFSLFTNAQSGRKIAPVPTPAPSIPEQTTQTSETVGYSESRSNSQRTVSPFPSIRSIPQKDSKNQDNSKQPEIVGDSESDVIKVETNLITIPVSVFDRNGLYIPNLAKENFQIFEDGKEQPIEFFATTETPFTVVLLLDTSPSTEYKIEEIQQAAMAFVNQLKPQDSVLVIEFDGNVHVLTETTIDRSKIFKGIKKADFGGGTSLYDAVDFSLRKRLAKIPGRKAVVLFTDGVDTTSSKSSYDESLREAEEADATIFPIYYNTFSANLRLNPNMRGTSPEEYRIGRSYLKDLSESTGGRVFNAEDSEGGLTRTFESIAEELRRQYSIGYTPETVGQTGQRKAIKVRVNRPNLIIRARDSYIVGEQNSKPAVPQKKSK